MLVAMLITAALSAPMDLATGADLTAIRAIETGQMSDTDAIDAWRAYLLAFPDSPLATTAWRRLQELDAAHSDWVPPDRAAAVARVARLSREQDEEAARSWVSASVAPVGPDGASLVSTTPTWSPRFDAAVGWDGAGYMAVGGGIGRGPATGLIRIGGQRAWYLELAARLKGPLSFGPWVEMHVDSLLRPGLTAGGEVLVRKGLCVEARGGVVVDDGRLLPRIGTGLAYRPGVLATRAR